LGADQLIPLRQERLLSHNALVASGTLLAGVLGFAFQSVVSHRLAPPEYGAVFLAITILTLITVPAGALTFLMSRATSRDTASGQRLPSAAMLRDLNRLVFAVGLAIGILLALVSPWLGSYFQISGRLLIAAAVGIPFAMASPLLLGEFQGEQRFLAFALLPSTQAGLKLIAALALGVVWGPFGIVLGVSLAAVPVYLLALWLLRGKLAIKARWPWGRQAAGYLAIVLPSTLALAALLSTDVLLVRHFFAQRQAGEYSAVVALSRGLYFATAGVSAVLFPKVVFREARGGSASSIVYFSIALVALGGVLGLFALTATSRLLLTAFAGAAYLAAATYLPWYAVGMTLLGIATLLVATHQSRGKPNFLAVLLPVTVIEPALILAFHSTLLQVVWVVDISMAALVVGLAVIYVLQERSRIATAGAPSALITARASIGLHS
jgi:O-antigen/teichoic acid export membrane protein